MVRGDNSHGTTLFIIYCFNSDDPRGSVLATKEVKGYNLSEWRPPTLIARGGENVTTRIGRQLARLGVMTVSDVTITVVNESKAFASVLGSAKKFIKSSVIPVVNFVSRDEIGSIARITTEDDPFGGPWYESFEKLMSITGKMKWSAIVHSTDLFLITVFDEADEYITIVYKGEVRSNMLNRDLSGEEVKAHCAVIADMCGYSQKYLNRIEMNGPFVKTSRGAYDVRLNYESKGAPVEDCWVKPTRLAFRK
jgi:hypothetical protein